MRIEAVLSDTIIRTIPNFTFTHAFPHLSKCHPTPILPQTSFFSRSIAPTLKIYKQSCLVKFRKITFPHKQTQKESIKHTLQINIQEKFTKIIKKIMQAYLPQLPQSEKPTTSTLPNFPPKLPSKSPKPPNVVY